MKTTLSRNLALCLTLLLCTGMQAQVTIGSDKSPATGAMLELKQDVITTKGLGMPRVKLTKLKPADPDELSASIGGIGNWILEEHTALAVYNINEDLCASDPIYKGIYVFNGEEWQFLGQKEVPSPNVHYYPDDRPQQLGAQSYPYRTFGTAGEWMLENMRYLPPVGAPVELIARAGEYAINLTAKHYTYPNADPMNPAVAPPTWSQDQGLIYTYSAATLGAQDGVNQNQAEGEPNEGPATPIQGVCPPGWHIPSDKEWNQLEKEIYDNAGAYSTYTPAELANTAIWNLISATDSWDIVWNTTESNRGSSGTGGHAMAMLDPCQPKGSTVGATGGKSISTMRGGFNAPLVGYAGNDQVYIYGEVAYFCTASLFSNNYMWRRLIERGQPKVSRASIHPQFLISVRCKR